jgi:putative ABC transport system permease protein
MADKMLQDIRFALRQLRLSPVFAIVAIASLALGAGANTAIFQLLDAVRLRTLPVKAPQELVELRIDDMTHARGSWLRDTALTNPLWEQIRDRHQAFSGAFAWADEQFDMSSNGEFRGAAGMWVSGDFFDVLGVKPVLGRLFTGPDDRRGCGLAPGAVVSHGFWQREFGGDASVIGKNVSIGKERIQIIGVTPPGFYGMEVGRTFDIALPICSLPALYRTNERLESGTTWWLTVMGRLKPGVSIERSAAFFQASSRSIFEATLPADYPAASVKPYLAMKLYPIPAGHGISRLREQYSRPLALLLAISGFVLLIACANLANLMLARASARQREIAVRLALGASRARLARLLLTEGVLLSVVGAGLGLLIARALSRFLVSFLVIESDPTFVALPQDFRVFAFTAALAILTCLVFASAPVLRAARTPAGEVLKSGSRNVTSSRSRLTLRHALVATQIAVSLMLLMGTLLFVRSLRNLKTLDPGFQTNGVLIADIGLDLKLTPAQALSFRLDVLNRLRAVPGVEAVAQTTIVPLTGANWNNRVWMDGSDSEHARVSLRSMIGPDYFRMLKTPLLAGREFDEHDLASLSKVAVVNQEFARELLGGGNALGKRFWIEATPYEPQTSYEIVGLVKNTKYHDLREEFQPVMFLPLSQAALAQPHGRFMIRSNAAANALVSSVRTTLTGISPNIGYLLHVFDRWVDNSLLKERLMATLSGMFGILAVVLTAVGLFGVISYMVAQRTNEIGIRIALGANRSSVVGLILRETAVVLAIGLGTGTILTLAVGRVSATLLFGLKSYDPLTLAIAGMSLAVIAGAAGYLPAWRASSVNPMVALRQD